MLATNTPQLLSTNTDVTEGDIEQALVRGIEQYFSVCEARIPTFIDKHFHYPGAITTNRMALGWDLLRAPANLIWAPIYALSYLAKLLTYKITGRSWLYGLFGKIPAGFTTQIQQYISSKIMSDLLSQNEMDGLLEDYIVTSLQKTYKNHQYSQENMEQFRALMKPVVKEALSQYQITRTASADITNSLSCAVLGAFAFQKFTPGGIGMAFILAPVLAKTMAVQHFILGETLGGVYYNWFPPEPTFSMIFGMTLVVMLLLSIIAALSGIITDPFQAAVGLHRRRLRKMLKHLKKDVLNKTCGSFQPKDQFFARVLDVFDMMKSGLT